MFLIWKQSKKNSIIIEVLSHNLFKTIRDLEWFMGVNQGCYSTLMSSGSCTLIELFFHVAVPMVFQVPDKLDFSKSFTQ